MRIPGHCISKDLVALAKRLNAGIRLEDLSGIRNFAKQRKSTKADAGKNRDYWPFYQLETFVRYKALAAGVAVDEVCPRYTSQSCARCGAVNKRHKHAYVCTRCGYKAHADANAAMNIQDRYGICCPLVLDAPTGGPNEPALNPVRPAAGQPAAGQERESPGFSRGEVQQSYRDLINIINISWGYELCFKDSGG